VNEQLNTYTNSLWKWATWNPTPRPSP